MDIDGFDRKINDSSDPRNWVLPEYAVCTGGSEITGSTYTVTIPAADAICVPAVASMSNDYNFSYRAATCDMIVTLESSSKITWDTFMRVSVRNQTNIINYTQLNF